MSSRVAVVGAGVSGLVAARELHRSGHQVTVFEAAAYAGGHANTVRVETETGAWDVDTGFIVFNDRNYPNFERLLDELGVATQAANMSFSVSDGKGGFEWSTRPAGLAGCGFNLLDPRFHRMLLELLRFFREARELVGSGPGGPSLREFLEDRGYSHYFVERLLVPQVSAVWSADPQQLWSFPAAFLAEFLDNHGALQVRRRPRWRSVSGGSRRYVEALMRPFAERIRLRAPVRRVRRTAGGIEIATAAGAEHFDEVVFASHSDRALAVLADPTRAEREVLGAMRYQRNEAVLHTDRSLLPRRRAARASWNFHLTPEPAGRTTVTYDMNRLQALGADRDLLVTLNRREAVDPEKVIRRIEYEHPLISAESVAAQRRWAEISGRDRTHYCGAYWRWGFHEDGVWSALRAVERLGALERGRRISELAKPAPFIEADPAVAAGGAAGQQEVPVAA